MASGLAHWLNSIREANSIIQDTTDNLVNIMSEVALAAAMESMMKELQDLKGQMQQIRASQVLPAVAQSSGANVPMSEDEDLEEDADPSWSDILRQRRRQATGDEAAKFLKLLESAPDLQALRDSKSDVALNLVVPEAPGPRRPG